MLVMDPPFGGLIEVLSVSVKKIWDTWRQAHFDGNCQCKLCTSKKMESVFTCFDC